MLNVREWKGVDPIRLVLSSSGDLNTESAVIKSLGKIIVFTKEMDSDISNTLMVKLNGDVPSSDQIADYLYKEGIQSLIIEGGAKVLNHFISTGFWDEARIFTGDTLF